MITFIRNWIVNIVTLGIFIVLLEMIIPSGKIKKFINLISGFVMLIAIINPLLSIFERSRGLKDLQVINIDYLGRSGLVESSQLDGNSYRNKVIKLCKNKAVKDMENVAKEVFGVMDAKVDVVMDEDSKCGEFGSIKAVYIKLKVDKKNDFNNKADSVNKIKIGKDKDLQFDVSKNAIKEKVREKIKKAFDVGNTVIKIDAD